MDLNVSIPFVSSVSSDLNLLKTINNVNVDTVNILRNVKKGTYFSCTKFQFILY